MIGESGLVLFGDVVASRRDAPAATAWLRSLVAELDSAYDGETLAPFAFTQGDEVQGLLDPHADPFRAFLLAALDPSGMPIRWVAIRGRIDPGEGPAIERTGEAFLHAREALEQMPGGHPRLVVRTGEREADELLADLTPALPELLGELTKRQKLVARLALVEGMRQAEIADRLGVKRATVSISFRRAHVRTLEGLLRACRRAYAAGASAMASDAVAEPA